MTPLHWHKLHRQIQERRATLAHEALSTGRKLVETACAYQEQEIVLGMMASIEAEMKKKEGDE